jgi:hypothetical protein
MCQTMVIQLGTPTGYVLLTRHMFDELQSLGFADTSSYVVGD